MTRFGLHLVGLLLLLGTGGSLVAQPGRDVVPAAKLAGNSPRTAGRLAAAQGHVAAGRWSEAIAEFQGILDEAGDDVMPADLNNPDHCVSVRGLCQMHLAAMPAAGLRTYRTRFDEPAQKALDAAGQDVARLRRLVDTYFLTRAAETAIDRLGDLAFERGDFAEAEQWWRMLALPASESALKPNPTGSALRLAYPDPQTDPALMRAKMILAAWFHGNGPAAREELKAFRKAHPNSGGLLAGRTGNYAATLQTVLSKPPAAVAALESWPTFAGDTARNGTAARAVHVHWLEKPERLWLDALAPNVPRPAAVPIRSPSEAAQSLAFFPVILGDRVLVADCRYVSVFDLLTGKSLSRFDLLDNREAAAAVPRLDPRVPVAHGQRYTLTVDGDRVYVRLGATVTAMTPEKPNGNADAPLADSFLVCLRLSPDNRLTLRWLVPAVAGEPKEAACYEGSPLVHRGRLYIGRTRLLPTGSVSQIECLDAETGVRQWRQDIATATELTEPNEPRHRQHLLTLAGTNVVYCTHAGAVGAMDAATGRRAWAMRYSRRTYRRIDGQPLPRDLAPAMYSAGRVYVAPADADRLFCLDAATGRTLWESKPIEVVQLLGVNKGRLIFTTGSFPRGIRGLDAVTGADIRQWMHPEGGHGELPSMGRGIFAGGLLYWPTSEGLRILNEDGQPDTDNFVPLNNVPCGNLAISNGSVVIATDREVLFFPAPARFLEPRKKAAAAEPRSPTRLYELAMAEADAGLFAAAEQDFWRANLAIDSKDPRWLPLQEECWRKEAEVGMELAKARRAQGNGDWHEALAGIHGEDNYSLRVRAGVLYARWAELDGQPKIAVLGWTRLLEHPLLRDSLFEDDDGTLRQVGNLAAQRLQALRRKYGDSVLEGYIDHCENELERRKRKRPNETELTRLAKIIAECPYCSTVRAVLARLAEKSAAAKDHEAAAHAFRFLVRFNPDPSERAIALAGLARAYEEQRCWDAAETTWQRLAHQHGDLIVKAIDPERPVRDVVMRRLSGTNFRMPAQTLLDVKWPLGRVWEKVLADGREAATPLVPCCQPGQRLPVLFTGHVTCLDADSGNPRWSQSLRGPWTWSACHADTAVVADPRAAAHIRLRDGAVLWAFDGGDPRAEEMSGFHLSCGRFFFLQGQRRLCSIDVETGEVLWSRWAPAALIRPMPPAGKFNPHYHAGRDRVLIQTSLGVPLLLNSLTGEELPCSLRPGVWLRPPLAVSEQHVCVIPDRRHVVLFDLVSGREVWTHQIENPTTLNGQPPQLLTDGESLLLGVGRNYGSEVDRLDLDTGERRWKSPAIVRREPFDLARGSMDRGAVYFTAGHVLEAISLADGKGIWDRPLTAADGGWQVVAAKNALLVHPVQSQPELNAMAMWRQSALLDFPGLLPTLAPLPVGRAAGGAAIRIRQEQVPSRFSLLVCDPKDGLLMQRFNFATRGTSASVRVSPQGTVVATPGAMWGIR